MGKDLITIGFNKHGEVDFGVNGGFADLSLKELQEVRSMIPVAIYIAESMWRRNNEEKGEQIKN